MPVGNTNTINGAGMEKDEDFKLLIKENEGRIKAIAAYYSHGKDDNDDLYQEILINIWKSLPNFRGESSVSTYIYRVALNTAITFANKEAKRLSFKVKWDVDKFEALLTENPEKPDDMSAIMGKIDSALNCLSIIDKSIMMLMLEDVSSKEISQIIGITEPNVRVKIHRIKNELRTKIIGEKK